MDLVLRQFDVGGAYLLADLKAPVPIYMTIPGILGQPDTIVELLKSVYGLRQAGHLWNKLLDEKLKEAGLHPTTADPCVYTLERGDDRVIVAIHVDDLLFASTSNELIDAIVSQLRISLKAELEEVTHTGSHLGLRVKRHDDGSITLSQPGYITRIAETLGLADGPQVDVPYSVTAVRPNNSPSVDQTTYRQVLGLLMFAATHTRPDVSFAVALLATHTNAPTEWDLEQAHRVVRYLYSTKDLGLRYSANGAVTMYAFVDAAYNIHEDSKGHSGIMLSLGLQDAPFLAKSRKQSLVTRSSTEAEVFAMDQAVLDIEWFRLLLSELGYRQQDPTTVFQDNKSAIQIFETEKYTTRTKHFAMRYHYVRQAVGEGSIIFEYLPTQLHTADILTKILASKFSFVRMRNKILNLTVE